MQKEENIKARKLGIVFQNLRVVGLCTSPGIQPTLGSLFNPLTIVRNVQRSQHPPLKKIATDFEGFVGPGEMLREHT